MTGAGWNELSPRESAVLAAVERRLTNAEIATELYISVRTVESHIASLRRKLDVDSRSKLISVARARRGTAVQVPQNSFVGRGADVETVRALLDRERWVTVVGAAGSGKTRLALELAAADERVPIVAELEHAAPNEVVGVVARAIGLGADSTSDLVAACGLALEGQRYLLVIDNCDRVTRAVAEVVGRLLVLAGSLTVLATSRSPVGGSDETTYQLPPLQVDEQDSAGAVRLFLDRARSAAPTAQLPTADSALVAGICRRLDGLPLAIELAAARVRHLPLPELAARLDEGFGPLDRGGPSSRHRTLETAFDWTWDLLDDDERSVLSRLAALPRTFDLELAEAVTTPGAGRVVLRLLDRSLVSPTAASSAPSRFRLLDSLRAFVLERTDAAIVDEVRHAHATYHAGLAASLSARARTDDSIPAAQTAEHLCSEVTAAIDWAVSEQHELALPLARALAVGVEQYGPKIDSLDAIARAARDPHVRGAATVPALLDIGIALCYGDLDVVAELAALALDRAEDDRSELAAHHLAGFLDAYRHRGRSALEHLDVAERLAIGQGDLWQLASVRQARGIALRGQELDDPDAAMDAFESAMRTYALAGDAMHVNNARYMMAATAADAGHRAAEATAWAEQCVAYARDSGNRHELAHAMLTRAALAGGPAVDEDLAGGSEIDKDLAGGSDFAKALAARSDVDADLAGRAGLDADPAGRPQADSGLAGRSDIDADLAEAVAAFRAVGDLRCLTRGYLLLAGRRPAPEQVPLLRQALDVARKAHDLAHQTTASERLIRAQWASGAHRDAVVTLGALINLIGYGPATGRCPGAMIQELEHWGAAIAEGQARGPQTRTTSLRDQPADPSPT